MVAQAFDPADPANKAETDKLLEEIRAYAVTDAVKSVTCAEPEVYNEKGETQIPYPGHAADRLGR